MGKKNKESLGRALIKDRFAKNRHRKHVEDNTMLHTTEVNDGYDWGRLNLQSVTAESSLQEFLSTAELAQREFTAEKMNYQYVRSVPYEVEMVTSQPNFDEPLTVPRRPAWHPGISAEDQITRERDAFLEWRRHLNELQAKLGAAVTPYERNLELWKQLWRTLEKSDVVLLLLDARNPLLFRCADLEKYAKEQNCKCILLLNKADLTNEYERKCWAEYFTKENVSIIFFSAAKETNESKILEEDENESIHEDTNSETDSAISDNELDELDDDAEEKEALKCAEDDIKLFKKQLGDLNNAVCNTGDRIDRIQEILDKVVESLRLGKPIEDYPVPDKTENKEPAAQTEDNEAQEKNSQENVSKEQVQTSTEQVEHSNQVQNSYEIFDRQKLLEVLKKQQVDRLKNPPRLTVGMIGYPNVGKSSTVNVLMQVKKVSVSSMPGHTRHIQSLILDEDIEVLDCPGLVLPAYAVTPDLLLTAVLPIDQMRAHDAAMARLCQMVSKHTFATKYGLLLPDDGSKEPDYKQILTAHAYNRGFMTAAGQPDQSRSARIMLKQAASGVLHWAQLPPGCEPQPLEEMMQERKKNENRKPTPREARMVEVSRYLVLHWAQLPPGCEPQPLEEMMQERKKNENRKPTPREARMVEGWLNKSNEIDKAFFAMQKTAAHVKGKPVFGIVGAQSAESQISKPWKQEKKHANKNKREKLRRKYAHLDEH